MLSSKITMEGKTRSQERYEARQRKKIAEQLSKIDKQEIKANERGAGIEEKFILQTVFREALQKICRSSALPDHFVKFGGQLCMRMNDATNNLRKQYQVITEEAATKLNEKESEITKLKE
jgi:hypothetical protein